MNRYLKILIIIGVLLGVAIATEFLTTLYSPFPSAPIWGTRWIPSDKFKFDFTGYWSFAGDWELFYKGRSILSTINATLLVLLLATYIDMYKKVHSEFTLGLIGFSLILLLYALSSNPLLQWLFGYRAYGLGPFAMLPDLFATLALALMLYLTMK